MIDQLIHRIEKARASLFISNCYSLDVVSNCEMIWENDREFVFSYNDHGIHRLVFFAESWDGVNRLIDLVDQEDCYLEYVTKQPNGLKLERASLEAKLLRIVNYDCRSVFDPSCPIQQYYNTAVSETAKVTDTGEINRILHSVFRTEISHLLSDKELKEKINQGGLTIHRGQNNEIDAILQAETLHRKFYINQIVNQSERHVIHSLLLDRLERYIELGGKYLYAWVEENNIASLRFHEKYGMKPDGLYNLVYRVIL